ncbi:MAG TPA: isoprenylcysteine carboxylmethyltransferase family protein [Planctomycetota bacterium]|nr:isoprenylcysteine carboxylmethyltransferase family protein [Planctomycetota bacterium]
MLKIRTRLRAIFIIVLLFWAYPNINSIIIGSIPIIIGQIIHFISAGYLVKQKKLITAGPYRFVRNPFYVGSFLVDVGLCLITRNIYVAAVYLPIFYLIVINWRVRKEEGFLRAQFGERYDEYCRMVPRIIPRLWPAACQPQAGLAELSAPNDFGVRDREHPKGRSEPNNRFDWQLIIKYREQWRLFRILGLIIYFYLRMPITPANLNKEVLIKHLSQPLNAVMAVVLLLILCFPPIYEFALKPLWKTTRK